MGDSSKSSKATRVLLPSQQKERECERRETRQAIFGEKKERNEGWLSWIWTWTWRSEGWVHVSGYWPCQVTSYVAYCVRALYVGLKNKPYYTAPVQHLPICKLIVKEFPSRLTIIGAHPVLYVQYHSNKTRIRLLTHSPFNNSSSNNNNSNSSSSRDRITKVVELTSAWSPFP